MISHERMKEQLVSLALGKLSEPRRSEVEAHAVACDECRVELRRIHQLLACAGRRRALSADEPLHESARSGLRAAVSREPEPKTTARPLRRRVLPWRTIMTSSTAKLAVAAVVVVAAVFGVYMLAGSRPAFADVVRPILTARTATFKMVIHVPDQPVQTWEGQFLDPGLIRYEMGAADHPDRKAIQIIDFIQGKSLVLVPAQKTAMVVESKNRPEEPDPRSLNMFREFRDCIRQAQENPSESVEYVGASQVAGHEAVGYRLLESGVRMTIWADARSLLPVQIEYAPGKGPVSPAGELVMTDIQFDVALDPAEFSLAVPPGYTEQTVPIDASPPTEADLLETLRFWTQATGGKFPSTLGVSALKELHGSFNEPERTDESGKPRDLSDPAVKEFLRDFMKIMRGLQFVQSLPSEADEHYAGQGAILGDATRPIFWYRPAGSATYRVIYADLSVLDVAFEDLPK